MSYSNPYTAPRATTPPLYYRRPEGVAPSYYAVPAQREVSTLHIPSYPTPRMSATRPEDRPAYGNGAAPVIPPSPRTTNAAPAPATAYASPQTMMHPFPSSGGAPHTTELFRPSDNAFFASTNVGAQGRWSYQQPQRQDEESRRLAQLEAEEAAMAAEEAALKAKKTELLVLRRRQEEEQLRLSEGWATLLEREERYYTEPVPDFSQDIAAREHQCAALHEQLQQAESHRSYLETQLANYEYVLKDQQAVEKEVARVREGLQGVEQRRRACIARAERFFDVETKRVIEATRAARKLDVQLKDMTTTGPLAQLQQAPSNSRSQSRCVSFAPADKSVIIDIGRGDSLATSASEEPSQRHTQGLSQEEESHNSTGPFTAWRGVAAKDGQLGGTSVCLGLGEEEEEEGLGLGGTSVAFSLNNSATDALSKRRRIDLVV